MTAVAKITTKGQTTIPADIRAVLGLMREFTGIRLTLIGVTEGWMVAGDIAAARVPVTIVSNSPIRVPDHSLIGRVVVGDAFDAADDWIAQYATAADLVLTADIPLAARVLDRQVRVGRPLPVRGLAEAASGPAFATAIGLLLWGAGEGRPVLDIAPGPARAGSAFHRFVNWIKDRV